MEANPQPTINAQPHAMNSSSSPHFTAHTAKPASSVYETQSGSIYRMNDWPNIALSFSGVKGQDICMINGDPNGFAFGFLSSPPWHVFLSLMVLRRFWEWRRALETLDYIRWIPGPEKIGSSIHDLWSKKKDVLYRVFKSITCTGYAFFGTIAPVGPKKKDAGYVTLAISGRCVLLISAYLRFL